MLTDHVHRATLRLAIVGAGRLGTALVRTLGGSAGGDLSGGDLSGGDLVEVIGPFGRGFDGAAYDAVLLCVPDSEIAHAAAALAPGPLVGHCSGASGLDLLAPHDAFSFHPLMTVTPDGADFSGATAAIDAAGGAGLELAALLARCLGMETIRVAAEDRAAYHAAACIASNFLVTLEAAAERVGASAGLNRAMLAPLVRATVENWVRLGAAGALTGPIARGDARTVARQRQSVADRTPELLALFDTLTTATRALAVTHA